MKKAYTLLEILIVVIIISLMIGVIGFFIPEKNKEQINFGKSCSNNIYHTIENELIKHKRGFIYKNGNIFESISGTKLIYQETNGVFKRERYYNGGIMEEKIIILSGGICNNNKTNSKYKIKLNTGSFIISKNKTNISDIKISSCLSIFSGNTCIPISKIIYNNPAQKIEQKFCINFSGSSCEQWEK